MLKQTWCLINDKLYQATYFPVSTHVCIKCVQRRLVVKLNYSKVEIDEEPIYEIHNQINDDPEEIYGELMSGTYRKQLSSRRKSEV